MDQNFTTQDAPLSPTAPDSADASSQTEETRLGELIARATGKYAMKDYSSAAELYSQATELQASMNGEMAIENADLLYSYGKCLYYVAVSNSEVLGSKVAGEVSSSGKQSSKTMANGKRSKSSKEERVAEEAMAQIVVDKHEANPEQKPEAENPKTSDQPYFQFTGDDAGWDTSDEEGEGVEDEEDGAEEEDDFANAFEMLDIARVLLLRKLESLSKADDSSKGKAKAADTPEIRQTKEKLADTYDLQSEISLEGEKFPNAVTDLRSALALKQQLFPESSSVIAECHYKLSLALEFSSVTQQKDEQGNVNEQETRVDEEMRKEAAMEMEAAINSCKLRMKQEEAELAAIGEGQTLREQAANATDVQKCPSQNNIDDVKEMVADMEQRVSDQRFSLFTNPRLPREKLILSTSFLNSSGLQFPSTTPLAPAPLMVQAH